MKKVFYLLILAAACNTAGYVFPFQASEKKFQIRIFCAFSGDFSKETFRVYWKSKL
ncbi:MAG: hypothetical protein ACOX8E_13390 [Ruminococcus sp.]|jgi:hypothetical protein